MLHESKILDKYASMRMFYGYKREKKDAPKDCEKIWLDDEKTHRQERDVMLRDVRHGPGDDIVVVLAESDLGRGRELPEIKEALKEAGAIIEVRAPEKPADRRGRPAIFDPDAGQDRKIKRLYFSYLQMSYVLERATEIMGGFEVKVHHLKRRYGNRWKVEKPETKRKRSE